ncbi:MAG TPA: helix-hairpin-helix domain-containing protein, partial [Bacteroidales bacterium]|nr:helix-hairpin-helix domain-containing protein [Bacteroidales bacterium]
ELKRRMNETPEEVLLHVAFDIWNRNQKDTNEAVVPVKPDFTPEGLKWTVPTKGDKLKLLELAQRNARFFMMEKQRILEKRDPEIAIERKLQTLKKDLRLAEMPDYIECFDNSNLQGTNPVASCVVFRNTRPSKKEYRHYNIKTVSGANDFASMSEIIFRRYKRLFEEGSELPKLIVIDGGKGQLSAAVDSLKTLGLYGKMAIIGLAKRLEEIYYLGDSTPMYLDKNSESLKIIRQLRDEAHRFAITFHRKKRDKQMLDNELLHIKGIGNKTLGILLKHFGSVHNIQHAQADELCNVIGKSKARIIQDYFKKQ